MNNTKEHEKEEDVNKRTPSHINPPSLSLPTLAHKTTPHHWGSVVELAMSNDSELVERRK